MPARNTLVQLLALYTNLTLTVHNVTDRRIDKRQDSAKADHAVAQYDWLNNKNMAKIGCEPQYGTHCADVVGISRAMIQLIFRYILSVGKYLPQIVKLRVKSILVLEIPIVLQYRDRMLSKCVEQDIPEIGKHPCGKLSLVWMQTRSTRSKLQPGTEETSHQQCSPGVRWLKPQTVSALHWSTAQAVTDPVLWPCFWKNNRMIQQQLFLCWEHINALCKVGAQWTHVSKCHSKRRR